MLAQYANINLTFVPYNGIAQAVPDLIAGRVDLAVGAMPSLLPQVRAGFGRIRLTPTPDRRLDLRYGNRRHTSPS